MSKLSTAIHEVAWLYHLRRNIPYLSREYEINGWVLNFKILHKIFQAICYAFFVIANSFLLTNCRRLLLKIVWILCLRELYFRIIFYLGVTDNTFLSTNVLSGIYINSLKMPCFDVRVNSSHNNTFIFDW